MTRSRRWLAVALATAAALGLLAWWLFPRDSPAPAPFEAEAYVYATSGFEEVDVLGGARHVYPATSGITVEPTDCGRLLEWRALRERSTAYELCGRRLRSIHEVHEFFGRRDERTYRCTASSSLRRGWTCTNGETTEVARGGVVGRERIGGTPTVHVHLATRIVGESEGTGTRDFWLRRPGDFPVRLAATNENSTSTFAGEVDYRERYELELRDEPTDAGP